MFPATPCRRSSQVHILGPHSALIGEQADGFKLRSFVGSLLSATSFVESVSACERSLVQAGLPIRLAAHVNTSAFVCYSHRRSSMSCGIAAVKEV